MSTIGSIEIQMLADLARLRQDMNEAKSVVGNAMNGIKSVVSGAMSGLLAGLSVAAFGAWIKGAVDAADEAKNLSQKIGIATKDLAGIQLAFKQAGVEGDGMQRSLVELSKRVSNGDDVFKRMGVTVKDSKQALYQIADVFASMPDGVKKTALATEVFGKTGADLIPMLNDGSAGMREMAEMAEKLGLVISQDTADAADEFNDTIELLGMSTQGMARQVMAELMPTMKNLAGAFLDNVTSGDKMAKGAEIIATALKGLFSVAAIGVEVFNTLGKTIGGVAAAVVAVAQGEFKQAWKILEETGRDIGKGWGETAKTIEAAWSGAGSATVDQANKMTKALNTTTVATKEQAKASEKAAEAVKKHAEEQRKLSMLTFNLGENESAAETQRLAAYGARAQAHADMIEWIIDQEWKVATANAQIIDNQLQTWTEAQREKQKIADDFNKKQLADWQRATDQMNQSLTDSLFRAFESGGEFFDTFWESIKNTIKTTVLRPMVEAAVKPVTGLLAGMIPGTAAAGTGAASGLGSMLGTAAPYLAAAYAVYEIAKSFDKSGTPHMGSVVGGSGMDVRTLMGDASGITNNYSGQVDDALRTMVAASTGILNALGGGGYSATAKFASDNTDASIGQYILGKNGNIAATVGTADTLTGGGQYAFYTKEAGAAMAAFTADIVRVTREQLEALDLPGWARDQLANLPPDADLQELATVAASIEEAMKEVADLGEAAEPLAEVAKEAADALREQQRIEAEGAGLQRKILELTGDTAAIRELERSALDESNRALYDRIVAIEDEQAAAAKAAQELAAQEALAAKQAAEQAAQAARIFSERAGLERTLLQLQGDIVAIRELERNALDESNRALYDQINALKDQAAATDAAAAAAQKAAQAQQRLAEAAASANAPVTSAQISTSAAAMTEIANRAAVQADLLAGQRYPEWTAAMMSDSFTKATGDMRADLWTNALMIRMEQDAQARAAREANAGHKVGRSGGGSESSYQQERDKLLADQIAGTEDLIDALDAMRRGMLDLKNELVGGALDPSNPALKYASERDFVTGLGRQALTGDMAAAAMFQDEVGGFLQLSQGYNASSAAYANDFSTMISLLDQIAASMEKQQSTATATLKVQQSGLSQVADSTERTARSTDRQARAVSVLEQRAIE